jgi:RNA polymerase sigma factor (sigma-70 family)
MEGDSMKETISFEAFIKYHMKTIRGAAVNHMRNTFYEVEDAIQACLMYLFERFDYIIEKAENIEHYTNKLIKNFFYEINRRQMKEQKAIISFLLSEEERKLEEIEFIELIGSLSSDEQELLSMFHLYNFSNSYIANYLSIEEPALRKRIERAHKKLKLNMSKEVISHV